MKRWFIIAMLAAVACLSGSDARGLTLYVAPNGRDTWSGRLAQANRAGSNGPLATLTGARDTLRRWKQAGGVPQGEVIVELRQGVYELSQPFTLGSEDSGTEATPIIYRAQPGELVRLVGGRNVSGWRKTTDATLLKRLPKEAHGRVYQTDLKEQGIANFGTLTRRGFGQPLHESHLELFFQDRPMTLARWPNGDEYARIAGLPGGPEGSHFTYEGERPERWVGEPDAWVFGYWYHDWADEYIPLEKIDTVNKTITLAAPKPKYGFKNKQRFYALNLLSELDQPGEWYLDRPAGVLFFWPPASLEKNRTMVSVLPSLVAMKGASHLRLQGLTLETVRGTAVTIDGGTGNTLVGCTLRNTGNRAISITGGTKHGVVGCDIYQTSDGGISITGGERPTLTPAGHYAENNHIYDYSRWSRTYRPAISIGGVGSQIRHNLLHHGQHNAIQLSGNDHLIEFNEIHSVAYETGDVGAFYMGRDWTARGTLIRHNYFHHIQGPGNLGAMGIYLDDQASGITIFGNLFNKVTRAVFIGGGVDNLVENNVFIDCVPAVHIDARGLGWQKKATDDPQGTLRTQLQAMPYQNELWGRRYPPLINILSDDPGTPKRNVIVRNISVGGRWENIDKKTAAFQTVKDNLVDEDPQFVNRGLQAAGDFRLRPNAPAFKKGFKSIPVEKIGLYKDERRASWPVLHKPRELPPAEQEAAAPPWKPRAGPAPVISVERAPRTVTIDGALDPAEWSGTNINRAIVLERGIAGNKVGPPSHAWIQYDETGLLVALDNAVDPNVTLRRGNEWGQDDAVEIALKNPAAGANAPIFVFRGFPSGHWLVSPDAGASANVVKKAAAGTEYGARVVDNTRWTAEWRIPWSSLGVNPAQQKRLALNLTVRKSADPAWVLWQGTGGHSFLVDRAGFLELK